MSRIEAPLPGIGPERREQIRRQAALAATVRGEFTPRLIAEHVEKHAEALHDRVDVARVAYRAGEEALAAFLIE